MRTFRALLLRPAGRYLTIAVLVAAVHAASNPANYLFAVELQRQREADIREIAAKMNVDAEFLLHPEGRKKFNFSTLFASLFGDKEAVEEQPQSEPVRESIARVKRHYALVAADTTFKKLAALSELSLDSASVRGKKKGQIKSEMKAILRMIDRDILPPLVDGLPPSAQSRDASLRSGIDSMRRDVRSILNAPHALDDQNIDATLAQLRTAISGTLSTRSSAPRWIKDPYPVKDTYRAAPKRSTTPVGTYSTVMPDSLLTQKTVAPKLGQQSAAVPSDVAALAQQLATPAKMFAWVYDTVDFEPYSGVAKGSLGTLKERRGNDWDQALLLRDLLAARGYDARLEWGRVTIPIARAMNLVGTEDPLQAANLLATAGFDGTVIVSNNTPVGVEMTHVWVRAFIPYMPNRGASTGTADTWVQMDPSFKRYTYSAGIRINGRVAWNEDEYLQTSAVRPPTDFYGDKIWSYIRSNNIDCQNLAQVAKSGRIKAEGFPFVPATLATPIVRIDGAAQDAPAAQMQSVSIALKSDLSATLATYNATLADLWGRKLTVTFAPATPDDAATIASYGGLFSTPAYLVRLKPVISLDDQQVAEGLPIGAGAALDMNLTFHQPNVPDDFTHHNILAGETHALVFDAGALPDTLLDARIARLSTLTADALVTEKLYLAGIRYMQHIDDAVAFASGVRWQRAAKRVFEADVRRQIDVTYNVAGAPLRLVPAENNIDVSRLAVGIVPIENDPGNRADALALAGLQSSYLEGAIWEEMESQQGISATKALLLARMAGQQLRTLTATNVDSVLEQIDLGADVEAEIRGAVAQGRIAKVPSARVTLNRWTGTGYILSDPATGAATYPISGGLAGGSTTGEATEGIRELLGSELWLDGSLGDLMRQLLALLGAGGEGSKNQPSTQQSDPVNMSSGNMHRSATDFSVVARGIPVALTRTYNSRSAYNGPFGYGWTFNYGEHVMTNADGSVTYREADGTEHLFALSGATFVSPPGKHLQLTATGSGWSLRFKQGVRFTFDARGDLVAQSDLNGNSVTINRDANGLPATIVDASGRTVLTFTAVAGKVTQVTDLAQRKTVYAYDGDDLVSVTDTAGKLWTMEYDLGHNMTEMHDPIGDAQRYDYDGDDRLYHHVDATGAEEFFHYDIASRQGVLTDRRGGERLVRFDSLGRATMEADPAGNIVQASFDADNNTTAVVDSRGKTTTYEFDPAGNVTKQVGPDGGTATTTYDANARPLVQTDTAGLVTTNSYDAAGNLMTSSRTIGSVTETTINTYDTSGQLLTSKDPNGGVSAMTWNANGTIATRTDAAQQTTTMTTDPLGRITAIEDPGHNTTVLTYDDRDRILTMKDPHENTTTFVYDDAGRRTSVTSPRGTTAYVYDAEGRVLSVRDTLGGTTRTTYNAAGDVLSRTDARGNTTRYEYDAVGRVTKMVDAGGGVWTYGYCAAIGGGGAASCSTCGGGGGNFCELTDPNGKVIRQQFDEMGQVTLVTDSLGHMSKMEYDKAGRKTLQTDANGHTTRYAFDAAGRLTSVTEASGGVTNFTYDKNGNKLTQKDANNHVWSFKYDAMNRLLEESDPLARKITYTYDVLGNLKTKTDAKNQVTTYTYNIRRLMSVAYSTGTSEMFAYDAIGRRTGASNANASYTWTFDALGRVATARNNTANWTSSYDYDAAGNRIKLTTPGSITSYTYDAKNRLVKMNDTLFGTFWFGYDPMDRRTELRYPNGITTSYAYDDAYRLTALVAKNANGAIVDAWSYTYDSVGNRLSKTDLDGKTEGYTYDEVDRLTRAAYADTTFEAFTYDSVGNRKTRTTEAGTITYSYDIANQLLSAGSESFTYDANGNMLTKVTTSGTSTMTYDVNNRPTRLATPTGTEDNKYGPLGERMQMSGASIENGKVFPIYDTIGNPIADRDEFGTIWTHRLYGPGIDEPLAEWRRVNNRTTYLHHDALGSVTLVSRSDGNVLYRSSYKAFGQMSRTADPDGIPQTRLGYTSREISVGGMMQYRTRYYEPTHGRFLQQDSQRGEPARPPSLNRYTYVLNAPTNWIDPSGRESVTPFPGTPLAGYAALYSSIVLMSAAVYGIAESIIYALTDNDVWSTSEFDSTMRYLGGVISISSIFAYINTPLVRSLLLAIGISLATAFSAFQVLLGSGRYTICEKRSAFLLLLFIAYIGAATSFLQDVFYGGLSIPGYSAATTYLGIAILNIISIGAGTFASDYVFLRGLDDSPDERAMRCR